MWHIPLPFTDANLYLSPRWGESVRLVDFGPWLLLCLAPMALVLWLYRYELRLISRVAATALLSLRLLVVLLLLFVVCLQPAVARATTEKVPQRVLIFVDRTASMDVADPQKPPVEKLRLARALHLASDLCSDLQLDEWIEQYKTPAGPRWVADAEYADDPVRRRQLIEERRRRHDQVCQRVDSLSRAEICRLLLAAEGGELVKKLGGAFHVEVHGFSQDVWDVRADHLDELFAKPAGGKTDLSRAFTDLGMPLACALEQAEPTKGEVRGVLLLTDGRHNRGPLPGERAAKLGEHKVPVYPIALGAREPGPDVAITGLEAPNAVFKDVEGAQNVNVTLKATLKVRGLPAQEITVDLQGMGRTMDQRRIFHNGKDQDYPLVFPVNVNEEGTHKLTVTVRPVRGQGRADNTSRSALVKVVEDQAEVLLIDGEARWEQHYLAVALSRDPMVRKSKSVVFVQPRLGAISEEELQRMSHPALTLPKEPDALAPYDCIILGDVSPTQLPLAERKRLEKYVGERGGTLVIVAGKRFMPLAFESVKPPTADETDPLLKLLPITQPRIVKPLDGFPITLTDEGQRTPLLQLGDSPEDADRWSELPPHFWGVVGRKKPAATTLAYFASDGQGADAKAKKTAEEDQALIAWQAYGRGRVLFVGLDSTWRWRFKIGDKYHHRFWGQLVRWAASDKLLEGGTPQVRYGTPRAMYQTGQEIDVLLRLGEEVPAELPKGPARARIVKLGGPKEEAVAVVELKRREGQPRVLQGRVRELPDGQYRVVLDVPDLADRLRAPTAPGAPGPHAAEFMVSPPDSREMLELTTDWDLLKDLADKSNSGSKVYAPEDASQLVDLLTREEKTREERTENRLWEWWPLLVLFLVLLTAEWVGRKMAGLP
jgi:hypothetical protein